MKFRSYDNSQKKECETEIRNADLATSRLFIQTWVPDYLNRILKDPSLKYALFEWNKIIKFSFVVGSIWKCFGAFTDTRLDGLLCLSFDKGLKIDFIATAPWNYSPKGKMRRIGSGLICFVITNSHYLGQEGEFMLNALPDAETFYENLGMEATGKINDVNLKEYRMPKEPAVSFQKHFKEYVI
jgi:hypothetical protein